MNVSKEAQIHKCIQSLGKHYCKLLVCHKLTLDFTDSINRYFQLIFGHVLKTSVIALAVKVNYIKTCILFSSTVIKKMLFLSEKNTFTAVKIIMITVIYAHIFLVGGSLSAIKSQINNQ